MLFPHTIDLKFYLINFILSLTSDFVQVFSNIPFWTLY
jgi:hypothetical protein